MTNEEAAKHLQTLIDALQTDIDGFGEDDEDYAFYRNSMEACKQAIVALRNQQEWIPVEKRLPEDDELMLVNYIDPRENAETIWIGWHEMDNVWFIDGEAHEKEYGNEVIAWMPLPEPYRGGEADD